MRIFRTNFDSFCLHNTKALPKGCELCTEGKKVVLFITGLCQRRCAYCPLSWKRAYLDKIWANEKECKNIRDALKETALSNAAGAGITGGDPLLVLERTLKYTRALKKHFGKTFHIHIYLPTDNVTPQALHKLKTAGIDEVRFHPKFLQQNLIEEISKIAAARRFFSRSQVGCEIPAFPDKLEETKRFVDAVQSYIGFLNINELEAGDSNTVFISRHYKLRDDYIVRGSKEAALKLLSYIATKHYKPKVHFCTASTKSNYQFRNRLRRRIINIAGPYDMVNDYILLRAALYSDELKPGFDYEKKLSKITASQKTHLYKQLRKKRHKLLRKLKLKPEMLKLDSERQRLLTSIEIAQKNSEEIKEEGISPAIVEELPTADMLQLSLVWL